MSLLAAYAEIQQQCASLLILLATDDPEPLDIETQLNALATLQNALTKISPAADEPREALLLAATETLRLTSAIGDAAAECHERLRLTHARSERAQQALSAYRDGTDSGTAHFVDQQR